jgi:DnaJ-class molecular chaperone
MARSMKCPKCNGKGTLSPGMGFRPPCPRCNGRGVVPDNRVDQLSKPR